MTVAAVTAIVRTKNSAATLEAALQCLHDQTVPTDIVVVDSGSTDTTLQIAERFGAHVVHITPENFSYGRALNLGAAAASSDIHCAMSSHTTPRAGKRWVEHALALFERDDVIAACGAERDPSGTPLNADDVFYQDVDQAKRDPLWGFSNTGSFWRRSAWAAHSFDETAVANEDKEWSQRALADGGVIAYSPALNVSYDHLGREGVTKAYRRGYREGFATASLFGAGPMGVRTFVRTWWTVTDLGSTPAIRRRIDPFRTATQVGVLIGRQRGSAHADKRE